MRNKNIKIKRFLIVIILFISSLSLSGCNNKSYKNELEFEYITLSSVEINNSLQNAINWLKSNLDEKGFYNYTYDYKTNKFIEDNNIYHKLKNSLLLSKLSSFNKTIENIHEKNLEFLIENYYHEDNNYGYIELENRSELWMNSLLLRTILSSPNFNDYKIYMNKLSNTILSMQNYNGSFQKDFLDNKTKLLDVNYSYEIILSLIEIYEITKNQTYLEKANLAEEYFIDNYLKDIKYIYYGTLIPEHTETLSKLYDIKNNDLYLLIIKTMNDVILDYQIRDNSSIGHFNNLIINPKNYSSSSTDGLITEGLAYLYKTFESNTKYNTSNYKTGLITGAYNIINLQYKDDNEKIEGAIKLSDNIDFIRIDSTQNAIYAFLKIIDVFGDEYWNYSYYPELDLLADNVEKSRLSNIEVWYMLFYGTIISIIIIFFVYLVIKKIKI